MLEELLISGRISPVGDGHPSSSRLMRPVDDKLAIDSYLTFLKGGDYT